MNVMKEATIESMWGIVVYLQAALHRGSGSFLTSKRSWSL